jgi:hypothetical protein
MYIHIASNRTDRNSYFHPSNIFSYYYREGSQSPTRRRRRLRKKSVGNDDNSMENHEASNSSDVNIGAPALGVAPVADEKSHADPADSIGRSALMQQLTKPADEMLQVE